MNNVKLPLEEALKGTFVHLQEPLLFRNVLRNSKGSYEWKLLEWEFSGLAEKLGDLKLPFRVGRNARSINPQWEVHCPVSYMTLQEFTEKIKNVETEVWYYFDYKHMQEWFQDKPEIITSLNWHKFGIDKDGSDSTLWIGSKGAHTNCHQDSYGYNLVAQIYGRKQWLLFPPGSSNYLEPTRIPYEESTVYSKFNFFCLTEENEKAVLDIPYKPKLIVLEPGDVLFVPRGWWHYVESLDCSVSVNIWLPLKTDSKMRLKEALVKLMVARIAGQEYVTPQDSNVSYTRLVEDAFRECKDETECTMSESFSAKKFKYTQWTAKDLVSQYPDNIKLLCNLESHELRKFLRGKRDRFLQSSIQIPLEQSTNIKTTPPYQTSLESIVSALCHPDVIAKATELLLSAHTNEIK